MVSLNDFIDPDLTASDVVHSSGYASAASGSSIGSGNGGLSLEQRRQLLNKPRTVGSYQYSELGRRGNRTKARTADQTTGRVYDASNDTFEDRAKFSNRRPGGISGNKVDKSIERRQHFIEPPTRNHNPYA